MTQLRQPEFQDVANLAKALSEFRVSYVVIGGVAMGLTGFPRPTKDIDILLPVDKENNARLLQALQKICKDKESYSRLSLERMNKGNPTELVDDVRIDLLYRAASRSYEDIRKNIKTLDLDGIPIVTLDVDGLLMTKQTGRDADVYDCKYLQRLKRGISSIKKAEISPSGEIRPFVGYGRDNN